MRCARSADASPASRPSYSSQAHEGVDGGVMPVGRLMVVLELLDERQSLPGLRVATGPQSREETGFFVGRMRQSGSLEIPEGLLQRTTILEGELAASDLQVDRHEELQEMLDTAMTIAEQAEGFTEVMVRTTTERDGHKGLRPRSFRRVW